MIEHPARGDIGQRNGMLAGNAVERGEERLQRRPAADGIDEALVFHLAPVGDVAITGFGRPQIARRQEPAGQGAIGQQAHAAAEAQVRHVAGGAAIKQGEADLVGGDGNAVAEGDA